MRHLAAFDQSGQISSPAIQKEILVPVQTQSPGLMFGAQDVSFNRVAEAVVHISESGHLSDGSPWITCSGGSVPLPDDHPSSYKMLRNLNRCLQTSVEKKQAPSLGKRSFTPTFMSDSRRCFRYGRNQTCLCERGSGLGTLRGLLEEAIPPRHTHIVSFLLDQNPGSDWWTTDHCKIVRLALEAGLDVYKIFLARDPDVIHWTLMFAMGNAVNIAIRENNLELLKFVIANGANPSQPEPSSLPILQAVRLERELCVPILAKHSPMDACVEALHYAARSGKSRCVQLLVEAGTDVNHVQPPNSAYCFSRDPFEESAFHAAIRYNNGHAARLFLEHGADWFSCDSKECTATAQTPMWNKLTRGAERLKLEIAGDDLGMYFPVSRPIMPIASSSSVQRHDAIPAITLNRRAPPNPPPPPLPDHRPPTTEELTNVMDFFNNFEIGNKIPLFFSFHGLPDFRHR
ncbi:predicted protein [Uncinocarpus reesii 1704]|uniref:Uncharacterized protein n=1 Tax=Uncinocarpus reesii (strain UAMH 1704) TaxID=336963 RepID=C4JLS7_UNCRE|nr:uncharacterized protein UREG_03785 [Uncinocarpus reesii 1704]EEP78939.1 predicted protein [Uncinocarpus reesii 1704]